MSSTDFSIVFVKHSIISRPFNSTIISRMYENCSDNGGIADNSRLNATESGAQSVRFTRSKTPKTMFAQLALIVLSLAIASSHAFHIQPKVRNGTLCNTADIPYFVGISNSDFALCSGSLLSEQ